MESTAHDPQKRIKATPFVVLEFWGPALLDICYKANILPYNLL